MRGHLGRDIKIHALRLKLGGAKIQIGHFEADVIEGAALGGSLLLVVFPACQICARDVAGFGRLATGTASKIQAY